MKTLRIIAFTFLLPVFFSYAMDMITLSNMCSDICGLKRLRAQGNEVTFNGLPIELRTNIVNNYFNFIIHKDDEIAKYIDQEKLKKYILEASINAKMYYANELSQLQQVCKNEIGGKKFLIKDLLVLPKKERDVFIRMANRSWITQEIEGNIAPDDYLIIEASKNETIKKGLQLKALCVDKKIRYIECTGGIFSFIFFFTWAASPFFGKMIGDIMFPVGLVGQGIGCGMYHLPYPFVGPVFKEKKE